MAARKEPLSPERKAQALAGLEKARIAQAAAKARRDALKGDVDESTPVLEKIASVADSSEQIKTVKGFSITDQETMALGLGVFFTVGTRILSRSAIGSTDGAMTETEIEQITRPICRILLRHAPKGLGAPGDFTDLMAIIFVSGAYALRLYDLSAEIRGAQSTQQQQPPPAIRSMGPATQPGGWTEPIIRRAEQAS